jgi:lysophospholipase L1-like esterase
MKGLHLVPGNLLLGFDREGTVDGVHPNDLGMMRHADALTPIVQALLPR